MTLCAAGLNYEGKKKRIVVIADRKISFFGGQFSGDIKATKVETVHENWSVMFAGQHSLLVPMLHAVQSVRLTRSNNTLRVFARLCSRLYREERRTIIETEVLSKYDVENYAEYLKLKSTEADLYAAITKEIESLEENWHLLFFGFDKDNEPHIFVITEYGKIQFCDIEGFAAIGSGAWAAYTTLTSLRYMTGAPVEECVYKMLAAKFVAEESADGVGEESMFAVVDNHHRLNNLWSLTDQIISHLRVQWKERPLVPSDACQLVKGALFRPSKRTRPKQSISQTEETVQ